MHPIETAVRKLARDKPDAVYISCRGGAGGTPSCYYTHGEAGGASGCLIGQAILAVYPEHKQALMDADDREIVPSAYELLREFEIDNETLLDWCQDVQDCQDRGRSWSYAVSWADTYKVETL